MSRKLPNIIDICNEIKSKIHIMLNIRKIHIATINTLEDKEKLNDEIEQKNKIHNDKINKIIDKYNKILDDESKYKDDMIIILNEVLFTIKMIDICISSLKLEIIKNLVPVDIIYEIMEFVNIYILNYINDDCDICLTIKIVDISLLFKKLQNILQSQIEKNKKIIEIFDENKFLIYGDDAKLFYAFLHILFYVINNKVYNDTISISIKNTSDKYTNNLNIKFIHEFNDKNEPKKNLFISNKIIIAHNGTLDFSNNMTKFKEISICIPIINLFDNNGYISRILSTNKLLKSNEESYMTESKSTESIKTIESYKTININKIINNIKIVCIDDSKMNIKFLSYLILTNFFPKNNIDYKNNIELLENGTELINNILDGNKYNIVFIDNNMPIFKGSRVIKIIRSLGFKNLIISVTGDNVDLNENEILECGANIVYRKPFKRDDIKHVYNFYIQNYSQDFTDKTIRRNSDGELFSKLNYISEYKNDYESD